MIYVTGDMHGSNGVSRLNTQNFPERKQMTKDDYVIIAGDFGLVWNGGEEDQYWLNWLHEKPFRTLFVDGNHENFDLLDAYTVESWNGGKVHKINDSVTHLMRGQVFTIEDKRVFTFGGAPSVDKEQRKIGISWWSQEMPSYLEYEEGLRNLDEHDWSVDYVVTHTCSGGTLKDVSARCGFDPESDQLNLYFDEVEAKLRYKKWFFGHFHQDFELDKNQICLYNDILKIGLE